VARYRFSGSQYVAVGDATILAPPDGLSWTPRAAGTSDNVDILIPHIEERGGSR
jgi:hypothetical protein